MVAGTALLLLQPGVRALDLAPDHLLAVFCAEASLFYALNAGWRWRQWR